MSERLHEMADLYQFSLAVSMWAVVRFPIVSLIVKGTDTNWFQGNTPPWKNDAKAAYSKYDRKWSQSYFGHQFNIPPLFPILSLLVRLKIALHLRHVDTRASANPMCSSPSELSLLSKIGMITFLIKKRSLDASGPCGMTLSTFRLRKIFQLPWGRFSIQLKSKKLCVIPVLRSSSRNWPVSPAKWSRSLGH